MNFWCILGTSKATSYAPSPTTNFLYGEGEEGSEVFNANNLRPTEEQYAFGKLLQMAMERLFESLGIIKQKNEHRIYDSEIIELSEETNVILILPPPQRLVQMSENDPDNCLQVQSRNDLMPIGLNTFEVLHLGTIPDSGFITFHNFFSSICQRLWFINLFQYEFLSFLSNFQCF